MNVINNQPHYAYYHTSFNSSADSTGADIFYEKQHGGKSSLTREQQMATMDWLKLFALLVTVAVEITAEGPKKKIRIHLPQTVKHIHHHKKIYITNHPASSQYAPAYLPGVKGAVAVPMKARPSVASHVPLSSVDLYDESRSRLPGTSPAASKLLPLYRARGHYGPNHSEWDEQEYDLAPPPEPTEIYSHGIQVASTTHTGTSASQPHKRVKVVKVNDLPRKKVVRKIKPKRVLLRGRPSASVYHSEEELPVSSFHEQFYSDLEEAGTIKKIKKPPRIEKIIDGDTEHIHTYSEEHIHKVVFENDPKVTGVVGVEPIGSMSALTAAHPLIPIKNAQSLTHSYHNLAVVGSMGTPSQLEYNSYNPRDVTHDHIFHDHGEIPAGIDLTKDTLRLPPKVSYNSQGVRINEANSKRPVKAIGQYSQTNKPSQDFTYYENIYAHQPSYRSKKLKPTIPTPAFDPSSEANSNYQYRPIPAFRFKDKRKIKSHPSSYYSGKSIPNFQLQQASVPAPFSVSTTVVHDYEPKNYGGQAPSGFSKYRDPLIDFKDSYNNDFEYDAFASSSNVHTSEDKNDSSLSDHEKPGYKSISTQNISFGEQYLDGFGDHMSASSNSQVSITEDAPSSMDSFSSFDQNDDVVTTTAYTIKETSPAHEYYAAMALQALHGEEPEDSNDNLQFANPPTTEPAEETTTEQTLKLYRIVSTDAIAPQSEHINEMRKQKRRRERNKGGSENRYNNAVFKDLIAKSLEKQAQDNRHSYGNTELNVRGNPQYGDKI